MRGFTAGLEPQTLTGLGPGRPPPLFLKVNAIRVRTDSIGTVFCQVLEILRDYTPEVVSTIFADLDIEGSDIDEYAYLVPYVETEEEIFLKTVIPSRKFTKRYLGDEI